MKHPRRTSLAAALLVLAASSGIAQAADPMVARMLPAYRAWVAKHNFQKSSLAIVRDGEIIAVDQSGAGKAFTPEPVASVSKSITGMCIVKLVEQGRLRYDATLQSLMGDFFARHGGAGDPRMPSITVTQLLTHSSGIGDAGIDQKKVRLADQMRDTIKLKLSSAPGTNFHYENKNFQVLGYIVERITGERYEDACRKLVLLPAGATTAHISRIQPFMSSWAGWVISAREDALFMRHFDPKFGLLKTGPRDWPKFDLGNRWSYSAGVRLRHNEDNTYSLVHNGVWSWGSRELNYKFMARFVYWGSGIGFAMNATPPADSTGQDLETELWKASLPQPGDVPARQAGSAR